MTNLKRFKKVKAIISDWDDTKVSTRPKIVEIVDNFAESLGVEKPGEEGLLKFWGQSVEEIVYGLFGKHLPHLSSQELLEQYEANVPSDYSPYPIVGVEKAVLDLRQMGYVLGIVSSGPSKGIIRDIKLHYPLLDGLYSFLHGREDTPKRKPNPEVFDPAFNDILYPLGISEKQTVYVGDFHGDFDAALARGLLFLAIADNDKTKKWFLDKGLAEELIFSSFTQVPKFFENLNKSEATKKSSLA